MRKLIVIAGIACLSFALQAGAASALIGVIGDLNGTECQPLYPENSVRAFEDLLKHPIDQVIMPGDTVHGECISYSGSTPYETVVKNMWSEFEKRFFLPARSRGLPLAIAPGNHDAPYITSSSRATFKAENAGFSQYWSAKKNQLGVSPVQAPGVKDGYPYYWAYVKNDALFIVLQSTSTGSLSNGSAQKSWLKALLKTKRAKRARATIAYGHVPPYPVLDPSVGSKYRAIIKAEQVGQPDSLMDLLLDNGVDLLIVGHSHAPYPAELTRKRDLKKIRILSMPCGHSPRKLYSKSSVSDRGFALVRVDAATGISLTIESIEDGNVIPYDYFPETIPLNDPAVEYRRIPRAQYK